MLTLQGDHIKLRALEPDDVDHVHRIENDEKLWHLSDTVTPYSVQSIKEYVDNAHRDIYEVKQLRLVICDATTDKFIGFIDLFDFDPLNLRAGIGIVIESKDNRGQGYGKEALQLLLKYCKKHLQMHQLYANIGADNMNSIKLFEKLEFKCIGTKKDWRRSGREFKDELLYQHIL